MHATTGFFFVVAFIEAIALLVIGQKYRAVKREARRVLRNRSRPYRPGHPSSEAEIEGG